MFNRDFYIQVVKQFEAHSYDTELKRCTYGNIYYILRKRHLFRKDEVIKIFPEDMLDEVLEMCAQLNNK